MDSRTLQLLASLYDRMPKIFKPGKVALVLSGRYAGRKVIVIRQSDEGTKVGPREEKWNAPQTER